MGKGEEAVITSDYNPIQVFEVQVFEVWSVKKTQLERVCLIAELRRAPKRLEAIADTRTAKV